MGRTRLPESRHAAHPRSAEERRITFVKVGRHVRIPESAVRAYIAAHTVQPRQRGVTLRGVAA
ncbi:excisionase family DNA-binding protein [Streptomyces bambusae]|uniref:excisionase family DNA-binding protein n=1 Tax=Streptomyces bambusae TaxID=1550616 RepID=UPI0035AB7C50